MRRVRGAHEKSRKGLSVADVSFQALQSHQALKRRLVRLFRRLVSQVGEVVVEGVNEEGGGH